MRYEGPQEAGRGRNREGTQRANAGPIRAGAGEPRTREEILACLEEMPPVAPVALRVMQLVDDPNSSAADLARVISRDQALTAKVLRTCNSSFYGLAGPVSSLSQAMVVLGLRSVRNLVLFHSLPVGRGGTMGDVDRGIWLHSVGSALGCALLAQELGSSDSEPAFLAGLFHDIGRFLLNRALPATYETLARETEDGEPGPEAERRRLLVDHTEIGASALERWRLGTDLVRAARLHHEPVAALPPSVLLVRGAEELLREEDAPPAEGGSALERLRIDGNRQRNLRERLRNSLERESGMFFEAA